MKNKSFLLLVLLFIVLSKMTSQCEFNAGVDRNIICGESVQLNIDPIFTLKKTSINSTLKSVYFLNNKYGYAVGSEGKIFKTIDGGNNWSAQISGTTSNLNAVFFTDSLTGYIVGGVEGFSMSAGTTVLKTVNGGLSWNKLVHNLNYYGLTSVFFINKNNGFILGGLNVKSTSDGGNTWNNLPSTVFSEGMMHKIFFSDENTGYVVGVWGRISKTINKGSSWEVQSSGVNVNLNSIYFINNTGFVVGDKGTILKTTNGGAKWEEKISKTLSNLNSVYFINSETGFIVGDNGTILRTKDGGENWEIMKSGTTNKLNSVFLTDTKNGYIVGDNGTCLKLISPNSFSWAPTSGLDKSDIPNPTVNVTETTSYIVTTNTDGCISKDTINVIVNPLLANAGADKSVTCGGIVQLNPVLTNYTGTGSLKYKWIPSIGLNNDTIPNPTATISNDITYTVIVSTPNGCTATDDIKVIVNPLSISAGPDKSVVCGGTVQLNADLTNYSGTGSLKFKWTPSEGLNNDTIPNPIATLIHDITYNISITTQNNCIATDSVSVIIIPMSKPEIGIVSLSNNNKNMIVWNKPISMGIKSFNIHKESNIANVYEKIGIVPYDSMSVYIDNQSMPDVQSNKYKLSINDHNGLVSELSNYHKTMHLAINKGIGNTWNLIWQAYEGFLVSTYNIYRGTTSNNLTLLASISGSNTQYNDIDAPLGDVYYQLEVISPNIVNPKKILSSQEIKNEENANFNSVINYNSSRSNIASNITSGINKLCEKDNIYISPNPVKNEFKINFIEGLSFEILNLAGQIEYKGNLLKNSIVDTSNFSSGVYLIKFRIGNNYIYKKIIKE